MTFIVLSVFLFLRRQNQVYLVPNGMKFSTLLLHEHKIHNEIKLKLNEIVF